MSSPDLRDAEAEVVSLLPRTFDSASLTERIVTPGVVLVIFTLLNFITYFDRGAVSGSLHAIRGDVRIAAGDQEVSDTRSGAIASAFMVGFMCACPLCAAFSGLVSAKRIIITGMFVWGCGCIGTACSICYSMLLVCRTLVGVGEAAFVGVTVTIIHNIAPPRQRTSWVGIFYSMVPVGTAAGMTVGALLSTWDTLLGVAAWRIVFVAEVVASVPVLVAVALLPSKYDVDARPPDAQLETSESGEGEYVSIGEATSRLLTDINYILIVMGFATYCFVVGAISVWAIPFLLQGPLRVSVGQAGAIVGTTTALGGMLGSMLGGAAVDSLGGDDACSHAAKCQLFNMTMILLCLPLAFTALFVEQLLVFVVSLLCAVIALFCITAPVNASILAIVEPPLRSYAISYSVFFIHFLGDFPSPTIAGVLSERFNRDCKVWLTEATCLSPHNSLATKCRWENDQLPHCYNEYRLRNALSIIFLVLTLAVPCWLVVWRRLSRAGE